MGGLVPKPPATRQEIFRAVQLLGDLSFERYGDPEFDQLARSLNAVSCALRKEAQSSMQTTKITDFFGFPHVDDGDDINDGEIELLEERLAPVGVYDPISFEDPGFSYR